MATSAAAVETQSAKTLIAKDHLKAFVERIERLEEEKKAIADDIRDVYAEAKGNGFDIKALRTIVRMRKQDKDERVEPEAILQTYLAALGMILRSLSCAAGRPEAAPPRRQLWRPRFIHEVSIRDDVARLSSSSAPIDSLLGHLWVTF